MEVVYLIISLTVAISFTINYTKMVVCLLSITHFTVC